MTRPHKHAKRIWVNQWPEGWWASWRMRPQLNDEMGKVGSWGIQPHTHESRIVIESAVKSQKAKVIMITWMMMGELRKPASHAWKQHCDWISSHATKPKVIRNHLNDDGRVDGRGSLHDGVSRGRWRHVHRGDGETELLRGGEELHHLCINVYGWKWEKNAGKMVPFRSQDEQGELKNTW